MQFAISELARRFGLRPSAIRYYEQIKVLPAPRRVSGQRRYDVDAVYRLAVLRRAQEVGFTLDEIRQLFSGFQKALPLSASWRKIAETKQTELDAQIDRINGMKDLLKGLQTRCGCDTVNQCGSQILRSGSSSAGSEPPARAHRRTPRTSGS